MQECFNLKGAAENVGGSEKAGIAEDGKLGHRSITNTLVCTHLVSFEGDEYQTATSKSIKEDEELLKAGFEYVTERDKVEVYRKRK